MNQKKSLYELFSGYNSLMQSLFSHRTNLAFPELRQMSINDILIDLFPNSGRNISFFNGYGEHSLGLFPKTIISVYSQENDLLRSIVAKEKTCYDSLIEIIREKNRFFLIRNHNLIHKRESQIVEIIPYNPCDENFSSLYNLLDISHEMDKMIMNYVSTPLVIN